MSVDGTSLTSGGPARDLEEPWPSPGLLKPGMRPGAVQGESRRSPLEDHRSTSFEPAAVLGPPLVSLWASCGPESGFAGTSAGPGQDLDVTGPAALPSVARLFQVVTAPVPAVPRGPQPRCTVLWRSRTLGGPSERSEVGRSGRSRNPRGARRAMDQVLSAGTERSEVIRQTKQTGPPVCHWGVRVGR